MRGDLPPALAPAMRTYIERLVAEPPALATRNASQNALDVINATVPETIGGSADLTGSNNTRSKDMKLLTVTDYGGRYIHWGIREHAMAAGMNGLTLHGGVIPYGGSFLTFTDYCRPSIRSNTTCSTTYCLDALSQRLSEADIKHDIRQLDLGDDPADSILWVLSDPEADLIVIGLRHRSPVGRHHGKRRPTAPPRGRLCGPRSQGPGPMTCHDLRTPTDIASTAGT